MTHLQAIEETKFLADLFPKSNDTILTFWMSIFQTYEQDIVRKSILEYANNDSTGFIDRTKLRATIENLAGNGPDKDPRKRVAEAAKQMARLAEIREELKGRAATSFGKIDHALKDLTDAELADLKKVVLAEATDALRPVLAMSDPKTGKALRFYMAERMATAVQ